MNTTLERATGQSFFIPHALPCAAMAGMVWTSFLANKHMALFPHFKSDQLWMVLVLREDKTQRIESWLAPEGRDGVRRIFRNMKPNHIPLAAISLKELGRIKRPVDGAGQKLIRKLFGEEQAVFLMVNEDGSSSIATQRARSAEEALVKIGRGEAAVGAFSMDKVCDHIWHMRHLLDNQKPSEADINLLDGNGLPTRGSLDDGGSPMPYLWTKQAPGENDE